METPKNFQEKLAPRQLFEDMIGNLLISFISGYESNDPELKRLAMQLLKKSIDDFKKDPAYLKMDYFAQAISEIESAIDTSGDEKGLVDKLKKIWDDFREKTI